MADEGGKLSSERMENRGVLCPGCEHLNVRTLDHCEFCKTPLFVSCPKCGARVERVRSQCTECRCPLSPSWGELLRGWRRSMNVSSTVIFLWVLGFLLVLALVILFS